MATKLYWIGINACPVYQLKINFFLKNGGFWHGLNWTIYLQF